MSKFNKNEEREREKGGERKKRNFDNTVTEIPLPKMLPGQLKKSNCGNAIAEIGKNIYIFVLAIVAMPLSKIDKKNYEICEWVKKKKLSRPQYFHNKSHVINYY